MRSFLGRLALLLFVVSASWAAAEATWGVRLDIDLPVDQSLLEFVSDPVGYGLRHRDVIDARAFVEFDAFGVEARYRSSTDVFVGVYRVLSSWSLLGQAVESSLGLYVGRDLRAGEFYVGLRGTFVLFGRLP